MASRRWVAAANLGWCEPAWRVQGMVGAAGDQEEPKSWRKERPVMGCLRLGARKKVSLSS